MSKAMTPYELADKLETDAWDEATIVQSIHLGINMIRRQADEIKALHQILGYEGIEVGKEYLDECVAELRKAQEK